MNMSRAELLDVIKKTLLEAYDSNKKPIPTSITEEMLLEADLGLDSLDQIEALLTLEEHFNIDLPGEEAKEVKTVKDVVDLVTKHMKE